MDRKALLPLLGMVLAFAAWLFDFGQQQGGVMAGGDPVLGTIIQWIAVTIFASTALLWVGVAVREVQSRRGPRFPRVCEKISYTEYQASRLLTMDSQQVYYRADLTLRARKSFEIQKAHIKTSTPFARAYISIALPDRPGAKESLQCERAISADLAELAARSVVRVEKGDLLRLSVQSHDSISIERFRIFRVTPQVVPQRSTDPEPAPGGGTIISRVGDLLNDCHSHRE